MLIVFRAVFVTGGENEVSDEGKGDKFFRKIVTMVHGD